MLPVAASVVYANPVAMKYLLEKFQYVVVPKVDESTLSEADIADIEKFAQLHFAKNKDSSSDSKSSWVGIMASLCIQ